MASYCVDFDRVCGIYPEVPAIPFDLRALLVTEPCLKNLVKLQLADGGSPATADLAGYVASGLLYSSRLERWS